MEEKFLTAKEANEKDMAALREKLGASVVEEVLSTINRCKEREKKENEVIEGVINQIIF